MNTDGHRFGKGTRSLTERLALRVTRAEGHPFRMVPRFCGVAVCWLVFLLTLSLRAVSAEPMRVSWTNRILSVHSDRLPQEKLEILYLEAFLRPGANQREWGRTVMPHRTTLIGTNAAGTELRFLTLVEPAVEVRHEVRARADELEFTFEFRNRGATNSELQWFQPACIRVDGFTGRDQKGYTERSFVYTANGRTFLSQLHRTEVALYRGGQVFLPPWTREADANPRPVAGDRLVNGLIGCLSADDHWILATASDRTHELFEGVYVCLHSDPLIDGLKPGDVKRVRQKVYLVPNDAAALLKRYHRDFDSTVDRW